MFGRLKILSTMLLIGGVCNVAWAEDNGRTLFASPKQEWRNLFAGRTAQIPCQIRSKVAGEVTVTWSVLLDRAVMTRGSRVLTLAADHPQDLIVDVELPALRPGVVLQAAILLEVRMGEEVRMERSTFHVFSPDVTTNREQWLKSCDITLFDPAEKTAAAFDESHIPYRLSEGPGQSTPKSLLIHGEGIEPARQNASWQSAIAAAQSGRRVLMLASSGSTIRLDDVLEAGADGPHRFMLKRRDVITKFDKRLDALEWPAPGKLMPASLHWQTKGETPALDIRDDSDGWPWLDIRYPNGGRLIWMGMGIIESWESTPAARYLFVKILEDLTIETPEMEGSRNVAP